MTVPGSMASRLMVVILISANPPPSVGIMDFVESYGVRNRSIESRPPPAVTQATAIAGCSAECWASPRECDLGCNPEPHRWLFLQDGGDVERDPDLVAD